MTKWGLNENVTSGSPDSSEYSHNPAVDQAGVRAAVRADGYIEIAGTNTSFENLEIGQMMTVFDPSFGPKSTRRYQSSYITSIANNTMCVLAPSNEFERSTQLGQVGYTDDKRYTVSEKPTYVLDDTSISANLVFGVDSTEVGGSNNYKPAHAGWVNTKTYRDSKGNVRYKSEVLIATSEIEGDDQALGQAAHPHNPF